MLLVCFIAVTLYSCIKPEENLTVEQLYTYFDSAYPWTRLGYTYDWSANSGEYGLTEFLIHKYAEVIVDSTYAIDEFIAKLQQQ